jgi:hypothetical protein
MFQKRCFVLFILAAVDNLFKYLTMISGFSCGIIRKVTSYVPIIQSYSWEWCSAHKVLFTKKTHYLKKFLYLCNVFER